MNLITIKSAAAKWLVKQTHALFNYENYRVDCSNKRIHPKGEHSFRSEKKSVNWLMSSIDLLVVLGGY